MRVAVLIAILVASCATAPYPNEGPRAPLRANNTVAGIELKTVYSATASTCQNLTPGYLNHSFAMCYAQGATFWVQRHTPDETVGSCSSPVPSPNTAVAGWSRLASGATQVYGVEGRAGTANEQTGVITEYAEGGGDLICVWH